MPKDKLENQTTDLARHMKLTTDYLNQQTDAQKLLLKGARGEITDQALVQDLAHDQTLFRPDAKHPKASEQDAFRENTKNIMQYARAMTVGAKAIDYGTQFEAPEGANNRVYQAIYALNHLTAVQKDALEDLRGVQTNRALFKSVVSDDAIMKSNSERLDNVEYNLRDEIAQKDPALNQAFPFEPQMEGDSLVGVAQDTPRKKAVVDKLRSMNSVEHGILRAVYGATDNPNLVTKLDHDESLYRYPDDPDQIDATWQASNFEEQIDHITTTPALHPERVHGNHVEPLKTSPEEVDPDDVRLNLADLDSAITQQTAQDNSLQA